MSYVMNIRLVSLLSVVASTAFAQPALTVYNQGFAVVRERVPLDLKAGENAFTFAGATAMLEADSVVLRDPAGKVALRVLEQSYRADVMSQGVLLALNEGRAIDFLVRDQNAKEYTVSGKVIRSGYAPGGEQSAPIIEVDGKLRFSLPGEPLFPTLPGDGVLKPTLTWKIGVAQPAKLEAELAYITGGLSWQSAYNLVAPEKGNQLDVVGWVTVNNQSGKVFENAAVKLMAGDVNKIAPKAARGGGPVRMEMMAMASMDAAVTEKAFDEFHLYTLPRAVTLRDRETKQVEFMRATGVTAPVIYVFDGASNYGTYRGGMMRDPGFGTQGNTKVWVMREFKNSEENKLGLPLPKGRLRFYRRDDADGRIEFTGESELDHTAKNEMIRVKTGDAFDVVGERIRTNFNGNNRQDFAEEDFEIKVRNRKAEPVTVRIVEHLYRWNNWRIVQQSDEFTKKDAQTIEFNVTVPPDTQKTVTYRVRYEWK
ncbi:DUF4139 domain-containing protein [Horticoccus sp. 23ND18S-11]|uniref:DUF4139 domain-containing protein n=1 Tax=Horticoccus sp. 23ND18S-11 TaxID=3391832 RepID=UPI0039C99F87